MRNKKDLTENSPFSNYQAIVDAVNDLTRVTIALHGDYKSKAEAIRALNNLSIPASRIAAILAIQEKHVNTELSRAKKVKVLKESSEGLADNNLENEDA